MTTSTVISEPADEVDELFSMSERDRCVCCGRSTLPVIEWRDDHALCNHCVRHCVVEDDKYMHVIPKRIDWQSVDPNWTLDSGFKKLGQ